MKIRITKKITRWLEIEVEANSVKEARDKDRFGKFNEAWEQALENATYNEETHYLNPEDL